MATKSKEGTVKKPVKRAAKKKAPEAKLPKGGDGYLHIEKKPIPYRAKDVNKSIDLDWKDIFSLYNKLGCPKEYYNPDTLPIDKAAYFFLTSERNTGKTTNLLLIAILLFKRYGMQSAYIRQRDEETTPKQLKNLFNVILANGYIQKITDGEYNGVRLWAGNYTLVRWDAAGKKEAESDPFLWVGCVQKHLDYKSTLNLPTCNLIIFDEFIEESLLPDEYVSLMDLHKTIGRNRSGLKLCMLANTTNYYHEYFQEFMIQDEVLNCDENSNFIKVTPLGTSVYYHRVGSMDPAKVIVNREYYGFENPKLKSITGGGWSMKAYQHLPHRTERTIIDHSRFIEFMQRYFTIELSYSEKIGYFVYIHPAARTPHEDAIIYTIGEMTDKHKIFRYGEDRYSKIIWKLYDSNKWFYSTNEVGFSVESYVNRADNL